MKTVGADEYGDWCCMYCGRYIDDVRAMHRRDWDDWRVPVCVVCNALIPLFPKTIKDEEKIRGLIIELLDPVRHKVEAIRKIDGAVIDELEKRHPDKDVYRVYVTRSGQLRIRVRRVLKE